MATSLFSFEMPVYVICRFSATVQHIFIRRPTSGCFFAICLKLLQLPTMTLFNARGAHLGLLLGISGAVAFILQGYDQALMNGLLTLPSFLKIFPEMNTTTTSGKTKDQNSTIQGTVVAIYEAGAAFGALSCYFIGDRLGRRRTIQLGAAIVLVGTLLQSTSFSLAQLIVGRIVTGRFQHQSPGL